MVKSLLSVARKCNIGINELLRIAILEFFLAVVTKVQFQLVSKFYFTHNECITRKVCFQHIFINLVLKISELISVTFLAYKEQKNIKCNFTSNLL